MQSLTIQLYNLNCMKLGLRASNSFNGCHR